ncbi:cytochrome P450 4F4-like [Branchiostoma floridae]|uniref:Cytochrome P450 4F4-like n=1 Tax=Branchiostoma floridae TaxID=7739 RepID=A0A9J7LMA2_BRAFL|nr:cytochrome P450 4F4-like [Branchiostoma floridae]
MLQHLYRQLNAAVDWSTLLVALCTWLIVVLTYKLFLRPLYFSPLRVMPSPKYNPILGQMWEIIHEEAVVPTLRRARKLGPISRYFFLFGGERVLVAEPDALKHILVTNHANYVRPAFITRAFANLADKGLLAVSGAEHAMQRKILNPAFKRENLKGMVKTFQEWTEVLVQYWNDKLEGTTTTDEFVELPVQDDMGRLTLDIIGKCAFSYEFNSIREPDNLVSQSVTKLLRGEGTGLLTLITGSRIGASKEFVKRRALCDQIVDDVIAERKRLYANPEQVDDNIPNDLLSLVMLARDRDTGEGLPEEVIRHEVMTFMVAGHETTSTGLSWLLLELSRHPEIQDRLRSEVRAVLPGDDTPITWDLLDQIPYLMWVVKETLRMHPPAPLTFRQALQDDRLGQYPIPAGTVVNISPAVMHRLSQYWEDPDTFNPERFAGDANRNPYTFLPFIAGPRTCIGSKFALAEMRAVTAVLVRHFQFDPVPGVQYKNKQKITMRPEPPLCLRVSKTLL